MLQIRDVLLIKNRTEEENLTQWDFNVVITQTGARRNVRVDIPNDTPSDLSELADAIKAKDTALGVASPLNGTGIDMADFGTKTAAVVALVADAKTADADAQALHGQALNLLGYIEGQTSGTAGTLYYDLIIIRDRLLQVSFDEEENLTQWGFKVVVSGHSTGKKAGGGETPEPVTVEGNVPTPGLVTADTTGITITPATAIILQAFGTGLRFYFMNTPGGIPGPATPYVDVQGGQSITVSALQLGYSITAIYLCVENIGMTPGSYIITFL